MYIPIYLIIYHIPINNLRGRGCLGRRVPRARSLSIPPPLTLPAAGTVAHSDVPADTEGMPPEGTLKNPRTPRV